MRATHREMMDTMNPAADMPNVHQNVLSRRAMYVARSASTSGLRFRPPPALSGSSLRKARNPPCSAQYRPALVRASRVRPSSVYFASRGR